MSYTTKDLIFYSESLYDNVRDVLREYSQVKNIKVDMEDLLLFNRKRKLYYLIDNNFKKELENGKYKYILKSTKLPSKIIGC